MGKRRNNFKKIIAAMLATSLVFASVSTNVYATGNDNRMDAEISDVSQLAATGGAIGVELSASEVDMNYIISRAGNGDIKAYGESLENGGTPQVTDDNTVQPGEGGTAYYIDAVNGDDGNDGKSKEKAWKTFEVANQTEFAPGDCILLKAGCEWEDCCLSPKGSGTENNPIRISSYGAGNLPKLSGNGTVGELIYLCDQEYIQISNVEITNTTPELEGINLIEVNNDNGEHLKDVRGICVAGQSRGEALDGISISNVYIHDVTGEDCWIGGNASDSIPGITKATGWDGSKRTGAIVFEIEQPETLGQEPTTFNDVVVENNVLIDNSFGGIIFKQWKGDKVDDSEPGADVNWANGDDNLRSPCYASAAWNPHTNIVIQDNYLSHAGSDYACNTIYATSIKNSVIQGNVSKGAGTCAIELYYTDDVVIQYNEIYDVKAKAGGADSNAIDPDKKATNTMIQYNYSHNTGDGILLCGFIYGSAVVRYNVVQDANKRYLNPHGDRGYNYIYNNVFYNTLENSTVTFIDSSGGSAYLGKTVNMHYIYNNIFYNAASNTTNVVLNDGEGLVYSNNCYYGKAVNVVGEDEKAICQNPEFVGDLSTNDINDLQLAATSPLINSGKNVDDTLSDAGYIFSTAVFGDTDIYGNTTPVDNVDIGVFEYQGVEGVGSVHGYVYDEYGYKIPGASVKLGEQTVTADDSAYYVFDNITPGTYSLVASMSEYNDGTPINVDIESKRVKTVDLTLGESTSSIGNISGIVKNSSGTIAGATVKLLGTDLSVVTETTTDGSGAFTFAGVAVNLSDGYTISVEKNGYVTIDKENVIVRPANTTVVEIVMSKDIGSTVYVGNITFDDCATGAFDGNDDWTIYNADNSIRIAEIVEDEAIEGNKYLHLEKTGTTKSSLAFFNKNAFDLSGTVTIEARVMRESSNTSTADQLGMYSYNGDSFLISGDPTSSKNPAATFAFSKGNIITHNKTGSSSTVTAKTFEAGQWYVIRNVANIDTGTFDFYIDDMETPVLSNQPLRTITNLDYFMFFINGSNVGELNIDYFRICQGAPYDYNKAELLTLDVEDMEVVQKSDTEYVVNEAVESTKDSINVKAFAGFGSVTVNGVVATKDTAAKVPLEVGENVINIKVTAEDGINIKDYTLKITKQDPDVEAYLNSVVISNVDYSPEFNKAVTEYSANVANSVEKVSILCEKANEYCTLETVVNGVNINDLENISLIEGLNTIIITVGSKDGTNYEYYTFEINRAQDSTDNNNNDNDNNSNNNSDNNNNNNNNDNNSTVKVTSIALNKTSVSFNTIGATETLTATVDPSNATDKSVKWSSSNEAVAVVNNGVVTAKGNGTATITAKAGEKEANCTVTVSQKSDSVSITLKGTKVSGKSLPVTKGKSYTLKAVVSPTTVASENAKVTWSTSNKKIATVSKSGKVKMLKTGTVKITAKTADGKKATVTLKAKKAVVKVSKLKIAGKKTMKVKDKQKLTLTVSPVTANNQKVTWKSSNKKIATVSSKGVVTAKKAGKVTITATAKDGSKKSVKFKITVKAK